MKKFLALSAFAIILTSCGLTPEQQRSKEILQTIDNMAIYDEQGNVIKEAGVASGDSDIVGNVENSDMQEPTVESSSASSSEPKKPTVRTVLVDQDYTGVHSVKGMAWLKAIAAKKLSGTSDSAFLEATLCRNGNNQGIDALGMYLARLDAKGWPIPELEWRHVRYLDAYPLHNTRAIAGDSRFTTKGQECVTSTFDLRGVPAMKECDYSKSPAFCPDGLDGYNILGALSENDFFIGFLPSRSTAHVTVTLIHDGGITVTPAVK